MNETLNDLWVLLRGAHPAVQNRDSYQFDPEFYNRHYPEVAKAGVVAHDHFVNFGLAEGRLPNRYHQMRRVVPDLDARMGRIIVHSGLLDLIREGHEGAGELAFELVILGANVDSTISDFSEVYYLESNPELANIEISPFQHFIQSGITEGRKTLRHIRENFHRGERAMDPKKPTCLICVHEFSKSGAPIVGLEIVRHAAKTHNVVVSALRDGPLLADFRAASCAVAVCEHPAQELPYSPEWAFERFEFAILNSVVSHVFAKYLVQRDIPFATYLHEYPDYTFPAYQTTFSALFSDLLVFSSQNVRHAWRHVLTDVNFDTERDSCIIPQAELVLGWSGPDEVAQARARIGDLIGQDLTGRRIVFGAGHAHWRKGTDMFAMTALIARDLDPETVFIWIGSGFNHEDFHFGVWMNKHLEEQNAGGRQSNLHILPAGPAYLDLCCAGDVMFLSSRLDPLPNVVFDAANAGCQIVLFKGASGFDDETYLRHTALKSVEFGNLNAAANLLLSVPIKSQTAPPTHQEIPTQSLFSQITRHLNTRLETQLRGEEKEGVYDVPVMYSKAENDREARRKERAKIWRYDRRFIWRSGDAAQADIDASNNWVHRKMKIRPYGVRAPMSDIPRFHMHIHAFHIEGLAHDIAAHRAFHQAARLIVTTDQDLKAEFIEGILQKQGLKADIRIVANQGRDILPFMQLFGRDGGDIGADPNEIWCHVHQKKALETSISGETWRAFLLNILLGDKTDLSVALDKIAAPDIGIVGAFDPYNFGWAGVRRLLPQFEERAGLQGPLPVHPLVFPVGNVFWAKAAIVQQMNQLFHANYPWPNEPLANDGTVFHLIERLWPAAAANKDLGAVFLDKPDQPRV